MIPQFPEFKKLEIEDRGDIAALTKGFLPYSDFNFISMWCWSTTNKIKISQLYDNLVVLFYDYITAMPLYSFVGINNVDATAHTIIRSASYKSTGQSLELVPEISAQRLNSDIFHIEEDHDQFDYIYSLATLAGYEGNRLRAKRNFVNRFKKKYAHTETRLIDIHDSCTQDAIMQLFSTWAIHKKKAYSDLDTENERIALNRLFSIEYTEKIVAMGIYFNDTLLAFIVNELYDDTYALLHFEKANTTLIGIYPYLMQENAKILLRHNVTLLDFEQDLGLSGLRKSKKSFYPTTFLKKYRVSLLSTWSER